MNITDRIASEAARFSSKPDRIFLGHAEHREFKAIAAQFLGGGPDPVEDERARMEFRGMKVYRVDAASHLSAGFEPPSPCG